MDTDTIGLIVLLGAIAAVALMAFRQRRSRIIRGALNRHVERVFNPDRKDTHWGKRKLKRDQ
jgi:hypothetical protein